MHDRSFQCSVVLLFGYIFHAVRFKCPALKKLIALIEDVALSVLRNTARIGFDVENLLRVG